MAFHNRTRGSSLLFGSNIRWWVKTRSNLLKQSRNWCLVIQKDVTTELNSDRRAKDVKRRWFTTICDFSGWLGGANTSYELTWTDLNWLELTWKVVGPSPNLLKSTMESGRSALARAHQSSSIFNVSGQRSKKYFDINVLWSCSPLQKTITWVITHYLVGYVSKKCCFSENNDDWPKINDIHVPIYGSAKR